MTTEDIDTVTRCWDASGVSTLQPPATPEQVQNAARTLGRSFPEEFVALYQRCNGADVLEGNIQLYPLDGEALSVVRASDFLRESKWRIPPELVVFFADNGQGDAFGLWLPANGSGIPLVVEVGAIFEEASLSVTGTSLSGFLRGCTAYYLLLLECANASLDLLGIPRRFRARQSDELDEEDYDALLRWADPGLPGHPLSSYKARLTADDVRRISKAAG